MLYFFKKVSRKIFQKYTKSFGGKIWANLHSVSPYNIFVAKIERVYLEFFHRKNIF